MCLGVAEATIHVKAGPCLLYNVMGYEMEMAMSCEREALNGMHFLSACRCNKSKKDCRKLFVMH